MNTMVKYVVGILSLIIFAIGMTKVARADEYRQHGTHEHGVAQMNLAIDDKDLHIEVISPAANIVGFEHQPQTPEQEAAVNKAIETLEDGASLFELTSKADCRFTEAQVSTNMLDESDHEHEEEHSEEHQKHHEHNEHDDDEEYGHEGHSEFTVGYHFTCRKPKKLQEIEVKLFTVFPGIEQIQMHALTDSGQLAVELNPKRTRIEL